MFVFGVFLTSPNQVSVGDEISLLYPHLGDAIFFLGHLPAPVFLTIINHHLGLSENRVYSQWNSHKK